MLFLRYLLLWSGVGMILAAAGILSYDFYLELKYRQAMLMPGTVPLPPVPRIRWRGSLALALLAWGPILVALGIVVVPSGMAGVRVSQTKGTLAGTLYPGAHFVTPLAESVVLFDTRDQLFTNYHRNSCWLGRFLHQRRVGKTARSQNSTGHESGDRGRAGGGALRERG